MNAIEIKGLEKRYDGFQLGSFDLTLPSGCIMGLVGENGAGKSTSIKLIMNAIGRDAGEISVLGVDNRSAEFRDVKEDIGVVLDEAYFPEVMSARNVGKVMALTYKNWDAAAFEGYLKKFSLAPDKIFKDYSRGMRMKLAIAAALSHGAKLLILDEATSGLDPMARDELLDIFNDFTRDAVDEAVALKLVVGARRGYHADAQVLCQRPYRRQHIPLRQLTGNDAVLYLRVYLLIYRPVSGIADYQIQALTSVSTVHIGYIQYTHYVSVCQHKN